MIPADTLIILAAPNVSEQMGGEAMKALQIFQAMRRVHPQTIQITHERNEQELERRLKLPDVFYVRDTVVSLILWRSVVLRRLLDWWFSWKAVRLADAIARERGAAAIVHQTEPNSPVSPRALSRRHPNVFGPINGGIYYPRLFRHRETVSAKLRRLLHGPCQAMNRIFFRQFTHADLILCAGGERTTGSVRARGCSPQTLRETVDCGIKDELLDRPRIVHQGENLRFVHFGRLVFHKGTALIIEALPRTSTRICLDIVGRGPELQRCKDRVEQLGLTDRVRFLDWYTSHADLLDSLSQYRGMVLPSIEDANGIVVQEAMALGLPPICLDWGGPQLLIEHGVSGYLIEPKSHEHITGEIARRLDLLGGDGALAESMSRAARARAQAWRWSTVAREWIDAYPVADRRRAIERKTPLTGPGQADGVPPA